MKRSPYQLTPNQGYIRIHRKLAFNPIWTCCPEGVLRVWMACLMLANWKPQKWFDGKTEVEIPRASFITSRRKLGEFCNLSEQQVRDALVTLARLKNVTSKGTSKYTIITVCNYDTYQPQSWAEEPGEEPTWEPSKNPPGNQARTHLGTTTNKEKNTRREEEEKTPREDAASGAPAEGSLFDLQADERPAPPKPKRLTSTIMTAEQRDWFAEYLSTHPKNTIQLKSATKLFYEKVKTQDCFDFIIGALRREAAGETQFMEGPCNWLASHLALYASGVSAATPIRMAPAVKLSKTDEVLELARRNFEQRGSPFA